MEMMFIILIYCYLVRTTRTQNVSMRRQGKDGIDRYNSDFDKFMAKMFTDLPAHKKIDEVKSGPNIGQQAYWYREQKVWDYGLHEALDKSLLAANKKVLLGGNTGILGAGDVLGLGKDTTEDDEEEKKLDPSAHPNLGPTGRLGPPPTEYNTSYVEALERRTVSCEDCSKRSRGVGLVCTKYGKKYQEMDLCVMEKMNCLRGEAVVTSKSYYRNFKSYFAVKRGWVRFSVMGDADGIVRLTSTVADQAPYYEFRLVTQEGYPQGWYSGLYKNWDCIEWHRSWVQFPPTMFYDRYTEYSMVWNQRTGWFLVSQPRAEDFKQLFNIDYTDSSPWQINYITVSARQDNTVRFIIHDLPYGLAMVNRGVCAPQSVKDTYPEDTEEIRDRIEKDEAGYQKRIKNINSDVKWWEVRAPEGSDYEY